MAINLNEILNSAVKAHRAGDFRMADKLYAQVLKENPNHGDANHNLGILACDIGKENLSIPLFTRALSHDKKNVQYWISFLKAVNKITGEDEPDDFVNYLNQNNILTQLDLTTNTLYIFLAKYYESNSRLWLSEGRGKKVLKYLSNKNFFHVLPIHFCLTSHAYVALGLYEKARTALEHAKKIDENDPDYGWALTRYLLAVGNLAQAQNVCLQYLKNLPKSGEGNILYANCLLAVGRTQEASDVLDKVEQTEFFEYDRYSLKGMISLKQQKIEHAFNQFKNAFQIAPRRKSSWKFLISILKQQKQYDQLNDLLSKLLEIEPDNIENMRHFAHLKLEKGLEEEGLYFFRKLAHISGENEDFIALGATYLKLRRFDDATKLFSKVAEHSDNDPWPLYYLGYASSKLGKFPEAMNFYSRAIEIKPNFTEAILNLSGVCRKLGHYHLPLGSLDTFFYNKGENLDCLNVFLEFLSECKNTKNFQSEPATCHQKAKLLNMPTFGDKGVIDKTVVKFLVEMISTIPKGDAVIAQHKFTQIYRRRGPGLGCQRHHELFKRENIVAKHCFDCYKVEIEVPTIIDAIKLYLLLDQERDFASYTSKVFVETRPYASGFYKAIIYCYGDIDPATLTQKYKKQVLEKVNSASSIILKRGCTEFAVNYPDFKRVDTSYAEVAEDQEGWTRKELLFDNQNDMEELGGGMTLSGPSLSDALILRNWVTYAYSIGDYSLKEYGVTAPEHDFIEKEVTKRGKFLNNIF